MKKFKSYKVLCLTLALGVALSGTVLNAANLTKTLKAVYNNIAISYNGQLKVLTSEPFIVDGTTYVPLRAIGEIMGSSVSWANNTVYITSSTLPSTSAEQEIAAKNFRIVSLENELALAKKELETLKGAGTDGTSITTAALTKTINKITDTYSDDYNVEWTYDLKLVSGRLELTASYDSRYSGTTYDRLTTARRKQLIKDICMDIADAHTNIEIRGVIKDTRTSTEKATYKYTKTGSYTYEEISILSLSDLRRDLQSYYRTIKFESNNNTNYNFELPINSIDFSERGSELTFTITTNLKPGSQDYRSSWNYLSSSDKRDLTYLYEDIIDDIEYKSSSYSNIVGVIKYNNDVISSYDNGSLVVRSVIDRD